MGKTTKLECSPLRVANIKKLRALRLTYRGIGKLYNVSGVQVHYWLNGRKQDRLREKPARCEICNRVIPLNQHLNHHHWDDPRIGIWLCPRCHMAAGVLDEIPEFVLKYKELRSKIELLAVSNKVGVSASV